MWVSESSRLYLRVSLIVNLYYFDHLGDPTPDEDEDEQDGISRLVCNWQLLDDDYDPEKDNYVADPSNRSGKQRAGGNYSRLYSSDHIAEENYVSSGSAQSGIS